MFNFVLGVLLVFLERIKRLDVQHGRPIKDLRPRDTIIPIAIACIVFCMWGLAYGLLGMSCPAAKPSAPLIQPSDDLQTS